MTKGILVFCEHYQREIEHLKYKERYPEVQFLFFKGHCGQAPLEWEELKTGLLTNQDYDFLNVLCGGCIKKLPAEEKNILIRDQHRFNQCFHFIVNPELVDFYQQKGCYLITPGWLQKWPEIIEQWGFDRKTARDFFHDSGKRVLLLDTMVDQNSALNLNEFASYINLPFESVKVGLKYLDLLVCNIIQKNQLAARGAQQNETGDIGQKEMADFAMALELLNSLARLQSEDQVIDGIKDMFTMLFAPRKVLFRGASETGSGSISTEIRQNDTGFILPVRGSRELLGEIEFVEFDLPQHREKYLNLATKIVNICGLAIENARQYEKIKELSMTDDLTKIANRRQLDEYLQTEWLRMERENAPLALIMVDIDYFKPYNDFYGHLAGDDCLKAVTKILSDHAHRPADLVARYGGEEFAIVMPNTDLEGASAVAVKIRKAVEDKRIEHEKSPVSDFVTVSLGVTAAVPGEKSKLEDLLLTADGLLYQAKKEGRNRVAAAPVEKSRG